MPIFYIKDGTGNFVPVPALQGKQGEKGDPGVYVGTEQPDDAQVWVKPDGEADPILLYEEQELTDEQKAQARANIGAAEEGVLPPATADRLGGVRVGEGLQMESEVLSVQTDTTLKTAGQAADAKAVGDAIEALEGGTVAQTSSIVANFTTTEDVAEISVPLNAMEYKRVMMGIDTPAAADNSQIIVNARVNNGGVFRELLRIGVGAISTTPKHTSIDWHIAPVIGSLQNYQLLVGGTNTISTAVVNIRNLYQNDMTELVFSAALGAGVFPAGTSVFIMG